MQLTSNKNAFRWLMIIISFVIISLILWNTYDFFQNLKVQERSKMKTYSVAQADLFGKLSSTNLEEDINSVTSHVLTETTINTPMITVDKYGKTSHINIDTEKAKDSAYVNYLIQKFKKENDPIEVNYEGEVLQTLYYGNSALLNKLKYYPFALLLIIILFAAVVYFFYRSSRIATQNKLWTGMAKETAHQIGTPLSSLIGWTEILKNEQVNPEYISEIEKDIRRLQTITDRFSKVGSTPTLKRVNVVEETVDSYNYLKARSSKLINFNLETPDKAVFADLNPQLFSWSIENLVKNAIDAMKGKGDLTVKIYPADKYVHINITDSGKGIPKQLFNKVFEPGYTSKKRGWGLGLSLAKRIIQDYHKGRIRVLSSELGKGTTMQISLKTMS